MPLVMWYVEHTSLPAFVLAEPGERSGSAGGTPADDLDCRSATYGSVLCGGLAGHFYGANGNWNGDVEDYAPVKMWEAIRWRSAAQMRYVRDFLFSAGDAYPRLVPHRELVVPYQSAPEKGYRGWAFAACTEERDLFLVYFEPGCARPSIVGARPNATYEVLGFDPETGDGIDWAEGVVRAGGDGTIPLPAPPAERDLAIRLRAQHDDAVDHRAGRPAVPASPEAPAS
jgi:Protein of unknown function (DUF4038)